MSRSLGRCAGALAALAAAVSAVVAIAPSPAQARSKGCGANSYSYAGVMGERGSYGVAATITSLSTPVVVSGHVAGWVGVGGAGLGPNGTNDWIQVGLNSVPGSGNKLYYEVAQPGSGIEYQELDPDVSVAASFASPCSRWPLARTGGASGSTVPR